VTGGSPVRPVTVVGAGRVGLTACVALSGAGVSVTLVGRAPERPALLAGFPAIEYLPLRPSSASRGPSEAASGTPALRRPAPAPRRRRSAPGRSSGHPDLLFAVPDDALAGVVREWLDRLEVDGAAGEEAHESGKDPESPRPVGSGPGPAVGSETDPAGETGAPPVAVHTSGVLPARVLEPLAGLGHAPGAWHPLTALSRPRPRFGAFEGVSFGISGHPAARARATEWTRRVGGRPLTVPPGREARYHAAAVFGSNWLASCLSVAEEELAAATGGEGGLEDLLPLARATLEELAARGLPEGATGPVVRGDAGTVERHLEALDDRRADLYRALARELLDRIGPDLDPEIRERLRRLLGAE